VLSAAIGQSFPASRNTSAAFPSAQLCFHYKAMVLTPCEPSSSHPAIAYFFFKYVNYMLFHFLFTDPSLINGRTNQISLHALNIHLHSYLLYFPEIRYRFKLFEINKTYCLRKYVHLFVFHKYLGNY
jgi:hypothetical protein